MDPKWTGRCGAFAIKFPSLSKIAHEKSNLSLMLVLIEVFCSAFPISSAIDINLLEYSDNLTGSHSITSWFFIDVTSCLSSSVFSSITVAFQPGYTKIEKVLATNIAGPSTRQFFMPSNLYRSDSSFPDSKHTSCFLM